MNARDKLTVLVTDGRERIALVVTRSLGRHGVTVAVAEEYERSLAGLSRFCARRLVVPSPERNPEEWLAAILAELRARPYQVFLPVDDVPLLLAAQHRDAITRHTRFPFAPYTTLMQARDKGRCLAIAEQAGIPIPRTWQLRELSELPGLVGQIDRFPVVIKPRESSGSRGVCQVREAAELPEVYQQVHQRFPLPLIQEYIPPGGDAIGAFVLVNADGEPRAAFAHRRLREYPPTGGPSTLRESIEAPELVTLAVRLLRAMQWFGVAMVEFRVDPRDGQPKLMEVNPRLWGSLALAVAAGVDFPYLLYRLAVEGDVEPLDGYQAGVQCRWLWPGDLLWFIWHLKRRRVPWEFFRFWGVAHDVLSVADPLPALGPLFDLFHLRRTGRLTEKLR